VGHGTGLFAIELSHPLSCFTHIKFAPSPDDRVQGGDYVLNARHENWLELSSLPQFSCSHARNKMANISLDNQLFFGPSLLPGGKPMRQSLCPRGKGTPIAPPGGQKKLRQDAHDSERGSPAPPMANVIEISSSSESDYSDFGEGQSHTSIPQVDELCPLVTPETRAASVADTSS